MLILKELQLKNFISHEDSIIKFKNNQNLLIDGRSGAGKSAIVEAIIWCLYGRGRVDNRSLIKHGKKSASVFLTLETDGKYYKIERIVTIKGKQELIVLEGETLNRLVPIKANGTRAIQEHLEKHILHSSYLLFINSIVYPQDSLESFVKQTAIKKKEILLEIIKAADYDEYYDKTRLAINKLENKISSANLMIDSFTVDQSMIDTAKKLPIYSASEQTLNSSIKDSEESRKVIDNKLQQINIEIGKVAGKEKEKKDLLEKILNVKTTIVKLKKQLDDASETDKKIIFIQESIRGLDEDRAELNRLNQKKSELEQWKSKMMEIMNEKPVDYNYGGRIKEINQQLIIRMNEKFDLCPRLNEECPIFVDGRNAEIKRLEGELIKAIDAGKEYDKVSGDYNNKILDLGPQPMIDLNAINNLTIKIESSTKAERRVAEMVMENEFVKNNAKKIIAESELIVEKMKNDLLAVEKELDSTKHLLSDKNVLIAKLEVINSDITRLQAEIIENTRLLTMAVSAEKQIEEAEKNLKDIKDQIEIDKENLSNLELLKEAFGPRGIKTILIDFVIPKLEDKINDILSKLSNFRIRIDTQQAGANEGVVLEGLFIRIYNELGEEFDYDSYSGGEKIKISTAIFEALATLQNFNFRILDESIVALDEDSTEKFVEVMNSLQERVNQVVVISHLRNIKDMFMEKITVNKFNGNSKITN